MFSEKAKIIGKIIAEFVAEMIRDHLKEELFFVEELFLLQSFLTRVPGNIRTIVYKFTRKSYKH